MGVRGKREGIFFITKNYLKTNRFPKLWNSNGETNLYTSQGIPFFQHQSDTGYQYLLVLAGIVSEQGEACADACQPKK